MDYAETITSYIQEEMLDDSEVKLTEDTSLFQDRILDSLNLVSLIAFLEKSFNIKVKTSEVTIENFDSVSNMIKFLQKKKVE